MFSRALHFANRQTWKISCGVIYTKKPKFLKSQNFWEIQLKSYPCKIFETKLLLYMPVWNKLVVRLTCNMHCVKSVHFRNFSWFVFSRIRTEYGKIEYLSVFSPNAGKYGPEKPLIRTLFTQWFLACLW